MSGSKVRFGLKFLKISQFWRQYFRFFPTVWPILVLVDRFSWKNASKSAPEIAIFAIFGQIFKFFNVFIGANFEAFFHENLSTRSRIGQTVGKILKYWRQNWEIFKNLSQNLTFEPDISQGQDWAFWKENYNVWSKKSGFINFQAVVFA